MGKCTVAVLFGSVSSEYEVSLWSAASVLRNIPQELYDVIMIGITKDGRWYEYTGPIDLIEKDKWLQSGEVVPAILSPDRSHGGILRFSPEGPVPVKIDVAFPVMHGEHAEDGTIQGLFEMAGIPYVGCGVLASAACMDKEFTHILLEHAGIKMAPWRIMTAADMDSFAEKAALLEDALGYPMFVKPANTGSSVGVGKAKDRESLKRALLDALRYDRKVLVEQAIVGDEVECAVLGNFPDITAAVVGEIVPRHEFYDYEGKYLDDSTDLYIPARIPEAVSEKIRETACFAFQTMGCAGMARVDFFARKDGSVVLNELNTLPGFTSISMYPKLFDAYGIPYPELIHKLLVYGMKAGHALVPDTKTPETV